MTTHRRIVASQGERRFPAYASHYRFGTPTDAAPLVVYVGGAAPITKYLARMETEPTPVADAFAVALARGPHLAADLLVCPCPVETEGAGLEWFADHLATDLLPAALLAPPSDVGLVGFSAGAAHALVTAVLDERRVAAAFGASVRGLLPDDGGGLPLTAALGPDVDPIELALFRNVGDSVRAPATYAGQLRPRFQPTVMAPRAGGHGFRPYLDNGSIADAFAFVLERLRR